MLHKRQLSTRLPARRFPSALLPTGSQPWFLSSTAGYLQGCHVPHLIPATCATRHQLIDSNWKCLSRLIFLHEPASASCRMTANCGPQKHVTERQCSGMGVSQSTQGAEGPRELRRHSAAINRGSSKEALAAWIEMLPPLPEVCDLLWQFRKAAACARHRSGCLSQGFSFAFFDSLALSSAILSLQRLVSSQWQLLGGDLYSYTPGHPSLGPNCLASGTSRAQPEGSPRFSQLSTAFAVFCISFSLLLSLSWEVAAHEPLQWGHVSKKGQSEAVLLLPVLRHILPALHVSQLNIGCTCRFAEQSKIKQAGERSREPGNGVCRMSEEHQVGRCSLRKH